MPSQTKDGSHFDRYLAGERPADYDTLSGIEMAPHYDPPAHPMAERPGEFPFTRGIHPEMYRNRFWTRRQQSGYGSPQDSNERLHFLLRQGQTGLNINPDSAAHLGLDDDPLGHGDLGTQGTNLVTLEDMNVLLDGIPLDKVSTTINCRPPTSAVYTSMLLSVADARGVPRDKLIGTCTNCALSQVVGPTFQSNTHFMPVDFMLRVGTDFMEYCSREMPKWNILNINAYNIRETGVNAIQEAAFAISLGADYIQRLVDRGVDIDSFAPRVAFFSAVHIDVFEEVAKLRAMRRIWARLLRERFKAKDDRSCWFRTAVQTSALPLTAQEPLNNLSRAAIQTLAAVLGGAQSIHTTSFDESFALPTEESHRLALRTQQIIAYETNVAKTVDPLGGSYFVESLTDEMEARVLALIAEIDARGGFVEAFKSGWIEKQINAARIEMAERFESGAQPMVGVNVFADQEVPPTEFDVFDEVDRDTIEQRLDYIRRHKAKSRPGLAATLAELETAIKNDVNVMPAIIGAVQAGATIGEIYASCREAIGFEAPH